MDKVTTAERLKQIMKEQKLRQSDIIEICKPFCEKFNVKLGKTHLCQYISGKNVPSQDKLSILSRALNVNEVWLMGYDVPRARNLRQYSLGTPDEQEQEMEETNQRLQKMAEYFIELDDEHQKTVLKIIKSIVEDNEE